MTQAEQKPQPDPGEAIQLEPPVSATTAKAKDRNAPQPPARESVPAKPLHLCPNCDYNLTGLIEQRCPECGEPFDLADARFRAFELSEDGARVRRWEKLDWARRASGVGLIVLGICLPTINDAVFTPTPGLITPAAKRWLMMFLIAPGILTLLMVCGYLDYGWARVLLTVGVLTVVAGLLLALL